MFETERNLFVSSRALVSMFVRDPWQDRYGDYSVLLGGVSAEGEPLFRGNRLVTQFSTSVMELSCAQATPRVAPEV